MEISIWTPPAHLDLESEIIGVGDEVMDLAGAIVMVEKLGMELEIVRHEVSLVEQLCKKPLLVAWRLERQTSKDPTGC